MKRKEMIVKIDDFLIKKGIRKSGSFDFATDLLNLIEDAGMAPPINENYGEEYGGDSQFFNSWSYDEEE